MVLGGGVWLPDGSGWLNGWLVVVFGVGRGGNSWPAMLGGGLRVCLLQTKKKIIIINKNMSPNSENTCQTHFLFSNLLKYYI